MRNVIFNIVIYVLVPVVLIWGVMYYSWKGYNSYRINHYGQDAVAVITRKWDGTLYYDVEFEGKYYSSSIIVRKKVFREVVVGERFYARILADIKIILCPLPDYLQDIERERMRVDSMYDTD